MKNINNPLNINEMDMQARVVTITVLVDGSFQLYDNILAVLIDKRGWSRKSLKISNEGAGQFGYLLEKPIDLTS